MRCGLKTRVSRLASQLRGRGSGQIAASWQDKDPHAPSSGQTPSGPRLNRLVVLAVLCSFAAVQVVVQVTRPLPRGVNIGFAVPAHGIVLGVDIAVVVVLLALSTVLTFGSSESWSWRRRLTLLGMATFLTYLPAIGFGKGWTGMAGPLAGAMLILLSGWVSWVLFSLVIGSMVLASMTWHFAVYDTYSLPGSSLVLGIVIFGVARLLQIVRYADARSGELAELAVINERLRFAKDLHDLLGFGLSAIVLKAEFIKRLVGRNPGRARDELAEMLDIARQALADVREVANGYRSISLAKEATSVASLLAAAGINAKVEINCGALSEKLDNVLAIVLREAVTNVVWHSVPRNCTIEARIEDDLVHLLVANDGAPDARTSSRPGGSGLQNLTTRLEAIGGRLDAGVRDGWFVLLAEAPLTPADKGAFGDPRSRLPPRG
jgi:two-component system sensor histidine kinase DesK